MSDSDVLLSVAFGLDDESGTPAAITDVAQRVQEAVQRVPTLRPLFAGPGIVMELARAMRTPLSGILVAAWNKREEIRQYADPKYPPHETHEVWLSEHEVHETLKPTVEVRFGSVPLPKLVFVATLSVHLHGAMLIIRDGRITHIKLGDVTTTGDLALGSANLISHEFHKWSLPGLLKLGEGVKLELAPPNSATQPFPLNR